MRTLRSKSRSLERILLMGVQGTGKTYAALTIAEKCKGDTFFYIDNDNSAGRLLETEFDELGVREEWEIDENGNMTAVDDFIDPNGSIILYHCNTWEANVAALNDATKRAKRTDWLFIDSLTTLWTDIAAWFAETVYGKRMDRYFIEVRLKRQEEREAAANAKKKGKKQKAPTTLGAFEGWMDYAVINPVFKAEVSNILKVPPCHLVATAEVKSLGDEDKKDKELRDMFGPYGVRPAGQKRTGHDVQTVILLTKHRNGEFSATTIKERGRDTFEQDEIGKFGMDYLVKVAGWRPKEVE